jgi:hypothetical protein
MSVTLDSANASFVRYGKNLNYVLTATLVARNVNEAMVGCGGVCVWLESAVRRSVLCWCVWEEDEDVFRFNLLYTKKCYKYRTFNAICKDNAPINHITVQNKKG